MKGLKAIKSNLTLFFIDKLVESISDIAYLLCLFVYSKKDIKNSNKCKKVIEDFLDLRTMERKIKKVVTDENDYTPKFNYLTHYLFTKTDENEKGIEFLFNHKDIVKLAKDFNDDK